jgi:hypothetical protein
MSHARARRADAQQPISCSKFSSCPKLLLSRSRATAPGFFSRSACENRSLCSSPKFQTISYQRREDLGSMAPLQQTSRSWHPNPCGSPAIRVPCVLGWSSRVVAVEVSSLLLPPLLFSSPVLSRPAARPG